MGAMNYVPVLFANVMKPASMFGTWALYSLNFSVPTTKVLPPQGQDEWLRVPLVSRLVPLTLTEIIIAMCVHLSCLRVCSLDILPLANYIVLTAAHAMDTDLLGGMV